MHARPCEKHTLRRHEKTQSFPCYGKDSTYSYPRRNGTESAREKIFRAKVLERAMSRLAQPDLSPSPAAWGPEALELRNQTNKKHQSIHARSRPGWIRRNR